MFDMRRQDRRNQADVMTQQEPKSDSRTFPTSSYAYHKLDVAYAISLFKSAKHTRILECVSETVRMKTIDSLINFCDRVATPRMTDTQIEIIEKKLLNLAEVDGEAARHHADLYRSRLNWERTRSAEHRLNFVDQARNAEAWLAVNSL